MIRVFLYSWLCCVWYVNDWKEYDFGLELRLKFGIFGIFFLRKIKFGYERKKIEKKRRNK